MESSKRHLENLIDGYFAGRLSFEQTEELFALLKDDPEVFDQLLSGDMPSLTTSSETYPHKSRLRKSYSELPDDQFEYLCIASQEGDLNPLQEEELNSIIANDPVRAAVYNIYGKVRLEPVAVKYAAKKSLKKITPAGRVIRMATMALSAAASLALLITTAVWLINAPENEIPGTIAATPEITIELVETPPEKNNHMTEEDRVQTIKALPAAIKSQPQALPVLAYGEPVTDEQPQYTDVRTIMPAPVSVSEARVVIISEAPSSELAEVLFDQVIDYHGPISLKEHLAMNFREKILGEELPDISPIKGYELASAGITGINKLFGWEMDLEVKKETSGEVNALAFNSRLINFEAPVKKAENEQ
jgi:hypothetical protein